MNGTLLIDNWTADVVEPLAPHKSTMESSEPRKMSGSNAKPKPVMSQLANWLDHGEIDPVDPVKLERMKSLFVTT